MASKLTMTVRAPALDRVMPEGIGASRCRPSIVRKSRSEPSFAVMTTCTAREDDWDTALRPQPIELPGCREIAPRSLKPPRADADA